MEGTLAIRWTGEVGARVARVASAIVLSVALALGAAGVPSAAERAVPAKAHPALLQMAQAHPDAAMSVIVRETAPASNSAERLVQSLGGTVTRDLSIIGSFSARIPGRALESLTSSAAVWRVWSDGRIRMNGVDMRKYDTWAPNTVWRQTTRLEQTTQYYNGSGVTVAVLDTGVAEVSDFGSRVVNRVDFTPDHDGLDHFGHGTHMAGILAGDGSSSGGAYTGVAPKAKILSVKVAGWNGATDVSVVIAAMQYVVTHKAEYNVRVMNLSFGTDSKQSYVVDPLDYAVEQVWNSGVLVVVSAGNTGPDTGTINKPGDDPFVVTVGSADLKNTNEKDDDVVAEFSSRGPTQDGLAKPDLLAPGVTIVSTRAPGSWVEYTHPDALVGSAYMKGTGTSQSAAVVSGIAALMFQANPSLTPNLAKATLMLSAKKHIKGTGAGAGLVDASSATSAAVAGTYSTSTINVGVAPSNGLGSLEASRGSLHVYTDLNGDGVPEMVTGEIDVLGNSWDANSWRANSWGANSWGANSWGANSWSGYVWDANSWRANSWGANSWGANSWSGMGWDANSWRANSWRTTSWDANSWRANSWGANSWGANSWGANSWNESSWS